MIVYLLFSCATFLIVSESNLLVLMWFYSVEGFQEQMTELDTQRLARGVHTTIQALIPRLADFHRILLNPPKVRSLLLLACSSNDVDTVCVNVTS